MPIFSGGGGGGAFNGGTITQPLTIVSDDPNALLVRDVANDAGVGIGFGASGKADIAITSATSSGNDIQTGSAGSTLSNNMNGTFTLNGGGAGSQWLLIQDGDGVHVINLKSDAGVLIATNGAVQVAVHDSAGNPIFQINDDGSLQGKTGKALTFNL